MRPRLAAAAILGAVALGAPSAAGAAYEPRVEVSFDGYRAGTAPSVTAVVRQAPGEEPTRTLASRYPPGFTLNPAFAVKGCDVGTQTLPACPETSRIGTADVTSMFGPATGAVYFTTDYRLLIVLEALAGVFKTPITGEMTTLPDGSVEVRFDDLPAVPFTESRIKLEGGARGIFLTPRDCGRYELAGRFVSWSNQTVVKRMSVEIVGCQAPPAIQAARVRPRRFAAGRRASLEWRLSAPARRVTARLYALRRGTWRRRGSIARPAPAGAGKLRIGRRWGGRSLRPGRYRIVLRAVGADGSVSPARATGFAVLPR